MAAEHFFNGETLRSNIVFNYAAHLKCWKIPFASSRSYWHETNMTWHNSLTFVFLVDTGANEYRSCLHQHWGLYGLRLFTGAITEPLINKDDTCTWPVPCWPVGLTGQSTSSLPASAIRDCAVNREKTNEYQVNQRFCLENELQHEYMITIRQYFFHTSFICRLEIREVC